MLPKWCFNAVGFQFSNWDEERSLIDTAIERGFKVGSPRGFCAYWPLGNGIEIWVALSKEKQVLSYSPHYSGSSGLEAELLAMVEAQGQLAGGLKARINPRATDESIQYPCFFNVPAWDHTHHFMKEMLDNAIKKQIAPIFGIQITAFAEHLECFDSEDEYYSKSKNKNVSATHFIPAGLFVEEGSIPGPQASFAGKVLQARVLTNSFTLQRRLYLSIHTLGAIIDVVASPTVVAGKPKVGGIVAGYFWLSGRSVYEKARLEEHIASITPPTNH